MARNRLTRPAAQVEDRCAVGQRCNETNDPPLVVPRVTVAVSIPFKGVAFVYLTYVLGEVSRHSRKGRDLLALLTLDWARAASLPGPTGYLGSLSIISTAYGQAM